MRSNRQYSSNDLYRGNKMVQQVKGQAAKINDQSLNPGTQILEANNWHEENYLMFNSYYIKINDRMYLSYHSSDVKKHHVQGNSNERKLLTGIL